ncbi:hypothetical protein cypCar_00007243 [Cyprinus carpio]|uniref:Retinal cone rhodopsin-sensitive cGMP 3',5'-cyclic phosphodiesterase subunit gamma n=1 Tax=Cyprinus carpio carpio TaxID=630221 RepID=A0A9J7Z6B8_CYPCA|nr:hypothetical protein cypCar_00007243 [Cyprinus carpio]
MAATVSTTPRRGPPKFKPRMTRRFKSKPPKKGVKGFGDEIPGMDRLGTDITVVCPWETFIQPGVARTHPVWYYLQLRTGRCVTWTYLVD